MRVGGIECQIEGENAGRDIWNLGAFGGECGILVQSKLPGIYEADPSEDA